METAAWAVAACIIVWRLEGVVRSYLTERFAREDRKLAQAEAMPARKAPLPNDLDALVQLESESWAREQLQAALQDVYHEQQDWDAVRRIALT